MDNLHIDQHISRQFNADLEHLREHLLEMGGLVEEQVADAVDALASIPGIEKEQANALVHAGLLTLEALNGVESSDLADIPGLAEHAESVLAAAHAEKERRSGADTNPLINSAPPEETRISLTKNLAVPYFEMSVRSPCEKYSRLFAITLASSSSRPPASSDPSPVLESA